MEESERIALNRKILKVLFFITFLICVPPVVLYAWARITGSLPSETEWEMHGGNHGPWWGEPQGDLVMLSFLAMLALPFITFLFALAMSFETKGQGLLTFAKGLGLAILQFAIGFGLFWITFWTID